MKIVETKLSDLIFAEYNPRQLSKEQFQQIKDSITRFGIVDPIIVNSNKDRKNIIIGGHQRVKVALEMGIDTVPCHFVNLTRDKERELNIRLNKNTGEWDWEILAGAFDVDELIEWGFSEDELSFPDPPAIEGLTDEDAIPEVVEPITKPGDLWLLGEHRVLCGDATISTDVDRLMDGEKADMVFTDPPYGVDYSSMNKTMYYVNGKKGKPRDKIIGDSSTDIYPEVLPVLNDVCNGPIYIFCGAGKESALLKAINDNRINLINTLVWDKQRFGGQAIAANYKPCFELFYYLIGKNKKRAWCGPNNEQTIWRLKRDNISEFHPTQKPVELSEKAIRNHSVGLVLDLFLGSGSTLIACEKTNRKCYGMELDPHYCDVIVKRWEEFTGKKAELG